MPLSNGEEMNEVLRLRGLPWSASAEDIVKWFGDEVKIRDGVNGVHLTMSREGRPSGEAYVAMETPEDIEIGVKKDQEHLGHRYIEVFRTKLTDMAWKLLKSTGNPDAASEDACIRLRGLPYECSKEEIIQFFGGMEIVPNGISLMTDFQGRSSGEAYVQFVDRATAERALDKHKEKIGHRYIEIFRSTVAERDQALGKMRPMMFGGSRPGPYDRFTGPSQRGFNMGPGGSRGRMMGSGGMGPMGDRGMGGGDWGESRFGGGGPRGFGGGDFGFGGGPMRGGFGGTGHRIHMRGIPFRATEEDIAEFFRPLNPANIKISYDKQGRASGEADVDFASHEDAVKAMKKDKENMQHRYIELFLDSMPGGMDGSGGAGRSGPGMGRDFNMGGGGYGRQGGGDDPMDDRMDDDRFGNNRFGGGGNRFGGDGNRFGGSGDRFGEDRFGGGGNRFGGDGDRFGGNGGGDRFGGRGDRFGGDGDRFGGGSRFGGDGDRFGSDGGRFGGGGGGGDRFGDSDWFGRGGDRRSPDRFGSGDRRGGMGGSDNFSGSYNQRGSFDDSGRDFSRGNFSRDGGGSRFGMGSDDSYGRGGDDSSGMRNYGGGSAGSGGFRSGSGFGDSGRNYGNKGGSGFSGGSSRDGFGSSAGREGRSGGNWSSNSGGSNWGPMEGGGGGSRW